MSDSNLASLAYAKEATFGTPPADGFRAMRITGESILSEKETAESQEIRSDRQVPDLAKVHSQASGSAEFELSVKQGADIIELAMQNDWVTNQATGAYAIDKDAHTITGPASEFDAIPIGAMVKVSDSDTTANDGLKRVVGKSVDGSTLTFVAGSFTTTETPAALVLDTNTIRNGTKRKSVSFEKRIVNSDGDDFYQVFNGMVLDTLSLNLESKAIITGSASFLGLTSSKSDDTGDSDGIDAAHIGDILNGTNNLGSLRTDGQSATEKFKTLSLQIENKLRGKDALGVEGNFDVGMGQCKVTGNISAYFRDNAFLTKVDDHSDMSIDLTLTDSAGRQICVYLPRVKFASGGSPVEAIDSDVMVSSDIQAILDPTTGAQIIMDVFDV